MTYENWLYYQDRRIRGSPDKILTNFEVEYTIEYDPNKMKSDFGDIRFSIEGNPCQYYEKEKVNSDYCIFIVKIPTIPLNPDSLLVRIHSGNNNAVSESTREAYTFLGEPDHESWTLNDASFVKPNQYTSSARFDTENNRVVLIEADYSGGNAKAKVGINENFKINFHLKRYYDGIWFIFFCKDSNNYMGISVSKRVNFGHYYRIFKVVNGVSTDLINTYNTPYDYSAWDGEVVVEVLTNSIKFYYNGTLKLEYNGEFPREGEDLGYYAYAGQYPVADCYAYIIGKVALRNNTENPPTVEPVGEWLNFSSFLDYKTIAVIPHIKSFRTRFCIKSKRQDTPTIFNIKGLKSKLFRLICGTRTVYAVRTAKEYPLTFEIPVNTPAFDVKTSFMIGGFMSKIILVRGWVTFDPLGLPGVDENVTQIREGEPITEKIEKDESITVLIGDHTYV